MKIAIIGAGSIGLLFAALLKQAFPLTLYTRTKEQAEEINRNGIVVKKNGLQITSNVNALPIAEYRGMEDLTIVTVKQYQLQEVIALINKSQGKKEGILFLQNGMGHLELLPNVLSDNVFVGSVEHGAYKENPFTVCHRGEGLTKLAVFKGNNELLTELAERGPSDFPMVITDDFYEMLLGKLVANAVINPLTAILSVENGQLIDNPFYFNVFQDLFEEIADILELNNRDAYFQQVVEICRKTEDNRSSMLKDIEAKRMTEVDAILGFVVGEAKKKKKQGPLTESFFHLLKGKEQNREGLN